MSRVLYNAINQITVGFKENHLGVDLVKLRNSADAVICHTTGEVVMIQTGIPNDKGSTGNRSYGNFVKIRHENGYYTLYAHLKDVYVKKGDLVSTGEKIGYMGESGNAYGVHLHFEVRDPQDKRINPTPYLDADLPNTSDKIYYQSYDNKKKKWLPNVVVGTNEYAGNIGNSMGGIYLDRYPIRVHDKNKGYWLPWVENRGDYAGNLGNEIDGVQIEGLKYRVHIKNGSWLSWVSKVDDTKDGYAGIYGKAIDAIQIKYR